jgi:hypothetical protein
MDETPVGYPSPPPARSWKRILIRILGAAVVLGAAAFLVTRLFGPSRTVMESNAWQARLSQEAPDLKAHLDAMTGTARQTLIADLVVKGWTRLSDDALIERAAILGRYLTTTTIHECAGMAAGRMTQAEQASFVAVLSDAEWQRLLDLSIDAAIAEWRSSPPARRTTDEEFLSAIDKVRELIPPEDLADWDRVREIGVEQLDDQDLCWYVRLKVAKLADLSSPYREILARSLAEPANPP